MLAEVPWRVSSLLQRIGRGNRRKCGVFAIFNSEEEKVMFEIMESCSKSDLKDIESFNNRKDRKEAQQKVCNDQIDGFGRKR